MASAVHDHRRPRMVWTGVLVVIVLIGLVIAVRAGGSGQGEGRLTVTTSPDVATRILVGDVARNTGRLRGVPLPAGEHEVCFEVPPDHLLPGCRTVAVQDGRTTTLSVEVVPAGRIDVTVEPATVQPKITVDGVPRDLAPISIPVAAGTREVCAEEMDAYEPPDCATVDVDAGATREVVIRYGPREDG